MRQARRRAARRAGRRHRHVRRQPQHQRLQRLHRRLRVLRLRPGPPLAGRLHARARRSSSPASTTPSPTARPSCASSPASTPTGTLEDYEGWLRLAKDDGAASSTCTPTARWRSRTCATAPGCRRARCSRGCATPGLGSVPGTAAEVLDDGVRQRISPNKLPVARWVEIIEAAHATGLRSTVTVMFGHIEEPHELAEHMRVVRALQERTGGLHRVRAALVHPVPHAARPHARDRGDLARGEPQAHRGVPARARHRRSRACRRAG